MANETMKISARKKFLLCFRPLAMDDEPLVSVDHPCSDNQVLSYIPVADKGFLMSLPSSEKEEESSKVLARDKSSRHPRKSARRIFSSMVNAVRFDTKLKRKFRNGKVRQDPYRPEPYIDGTTDSSVSFSSSASSSSFSFSNSISISRSSTCSSSSTTGLNWENLSRSNSSEGKQSETQSNHEEPRQQQAKKTKKKKNSSAFIDLYSSCYGLLLILISFLIVIFWGRLFAILCTSICFYLAPRRAGDLVWKRLDFDSAQYKKKVIIEGLLERSNRSNCLV